MQTKQFLFHLFAVTAQLNYEVKMPNATLSGRLLAPGIQLFLFPNLDTFLIIQFLTNRPFRLTQCCTQFKSPGVKILCVLYLHYNVTFTLK